MEIDFSHYRMNDYLWIDIYKKKLGKDAFHKFLDTVYSWLLRLKPGESINIATSKPITDQNRDLFIKSACLFISEGHDGYEFSNNYTVITHKANQPVIWNKKKKEK